MSLIIAANFDTFDHAEAAASELMKAGVPSDAMHTFFVNPAGEHARYPIGGDRYADPKSEGALSGTVIGAIGGAVVGVLVGALIARFFGNTLWPIVILAGVGAYLGSLIGAMSGLGRGRSRSDGKDLTTPEEKIRPSGVLLAVRTEPEDEKRMASILRNAGGREIERAHGHWQDGRWEDFDPLVGPDLKKNI